MPLNVLSVIHFPIFGGPANRNAMVADSLRSKDVRTHIVIPDEPGNAATRLRELGVEPVQIPLKRLRAVRNPSTHLDYLRAGRGDIGRLRALIRDLDIDVVLVNGTGNPHAALAARAEGTPVVWQLLDTFPPRAFLSVMMPVALRLSEVLMTNGMTVAAAHPGAMAFEGPLISFGPCIPTERFTSDPDVRRAARRELGVDDDDVVVGTVNNVNKMKGHRTFIRAAAELRRTRDARFVILGAIGDHDYVDSLRSLAVSLGLKLDVDLIIRDAGARVHQLAQAFDLFWLTSEPRSEGMSNALAEAQCLGIPVISTRTGAVHECLVDGRTGFLVPPWDTDALVARSSALLDNPALHKEFSLAGAQHIRDNFSVDQVAERHHEAYRAAIERRAKRGRAT